MEEKTQQYPTFYPCSESEWEELNDFANRLLGLPNEGAETYSKPIIDKYGVYYFIVQSELGALQSVNLSKCVEYDYIQFNTEIK